MLESIVDKIEKDTFKNLLYVFFISCFWAVSFYLFKPSIFKEPCHVQFFILFASSFLCAVLYFPILVYTEAFLQPIIHNFSNDIANLRMGFYVCAIVIIKSLYIAVGIYYQMDFTQYLKFYFTITGIWIFVLICYRIYYGYNKSTNTNN